MDPVAAFEAIWTPMPFCSAKWLWNYLDAFWITDLHVKQIFPHYLPWKVCLCIFDKWGRWCRSALHHILLVLIFSRRLSEESLTQAVASPGDDAAERTRLATSSLCSVSFAVLAGTKSSKNLPVTEVSSSHNECKHRANLLSKKMPSYAVTLEIWTDKKRD